jgi:hypothetical protein
MNEQEIRAAVKRVVGASKRDEERMPDEAFELVAQLLVDIHRIANALEKAWVSRW